MRILIAYNEPVLPHTHPEADSEYEVLDVVDSIAARLGQSGMELSRVGIGRNLAAFRDSLRHSQPDVVLNLFEGFADDPSSECRFARILEDEGVAFTGCSSETLWRAGRKDIAKQIFVQAGLATPAWTVVENLPLPDCRLNWPVIVKPAFRDASVGIHQASVVTHRAQLEKQLAHAAGQYGLPVLVEEFIHGREISVALTDRPGLLVLPLVETKFVGTNGDWPIDSYDAKWQPGSRDYRACTLHYPAELTSELADRIVSMATTAYHLLRCRGFATIDFRVHDNKTYLLEVNPNADLKPSNCLTDLLQLAGIEYTDFVLQMLHSAREPNCAVAGLCEAGNNDADRGHRPQLQF